MMKESRLYLNFLKQNWWIILIPTLIGLLLSGIFIFTRSSCFLESQILEQKYKTQDVSEKIALTDQAVTMARSNQVQDKFKLPKEVSVNIFKPSPLSVQVEILYCTRYSTRPVLFMFTDFLTENYELSPLGNIHKTKQLDRNIYIIPTLLTALGFSLGIIISLIRNYFRKY